MMVGVAHEGLESRVAARCREDGEFRMAARFWDGVVTFALPGVELVLTLVGGEPTAGGGEQTTLSFTAPTGVWEKMLEPVPPPMFNDLAPAAAAGLRFEGSVETYWQYYPALRRLMEVVREEWNA